MTLFPSAWGSAYRCPTLVASSPPDYELRTMYQNAYGGATSAAATPAAPLPKKGLDGLVEFDVVRAAGACFLSY
jgi:hypothetical protein